MHRPHAHGRTALQLWRVAFMPTRFGCVSLLGRRARLPPAAAPHSESRPRVIRVSGSLTSNFLARSPLMPNASIRSIFGPK